MRIGCRTAMAFPFALVLTLFLGSFAAPQAALAQTLPQSVVKLVGNTGEATVADTSTTPNNHAQAFTTGTNVSGYLLTRVDLKLDVSGSQGKPDFQVRVKADSSGAPGSTLATLSAAVGDASTGGEPSTGNNRYNAPGGGVNLAPNTTYHVVFELEAWGGRKLVKVTATSSDNEDDDAAAGWTIADDSRSCDPNGGCTWTTSNNSKQIEIHGVAKEVDPPVLTSVEAVSPTRLVLTYGEVLDTGSVPLATAFTLKVNGGTGVNPSSVAVDGSTVTLTLAQASAISISDTVTLSYVIPTGTDANPIQDLVGNDAVALTDQAVTVDSTTVALSSVGVEGTTMKLAFNRSLDGSSVPATTDFKVTVGTAAAVDPTAVTILLSDVWLTLPSAVTSSDTVTVSYTVPAANPIKDRFGNSAAAFTGQSATHTDVTRPEILGFDNSDFDRGTHGQDYQVWLRFNEPLDETSVPHVDDFRVEWPVGTPLDLEFVEVVGSDVVVTTASRMDAGSSGTDVKVTYTAGTNPIRDLAGNNTDYSGGTHIVVDTLGPFVERAELVGTQLTIYFNEQLDGRNTFKEDYTVKVDGTSVTIDSGIRHQVSVPRWVRLTLATSVTSADQEVTVSYSSPSNANQRISDRLLNYAASFSDQPVTVRDTTAPTLQTATAAGTGMTLTYNELLKTDSVPAAGDFSVVINSGTAENPSSVAIVDKAVYLTLPTAVTSTDTVTVSYTVGTNPLQDRSGNSAAALTTQAVTVQADATAPALQSATAEGTRLMLTYDEPLDDASVPAASAYTVTVGGSTVSLAASNPVAVSGLAVALTLASPVSDGDTVTLTYEVPTGTGATPIQDRSGNDAVALTGQAVTLVDTVAPVLLAAGVQDKELRLIYNEALDATSRPPKTAFGVKVNSGKALNPSRVEVSGTVVTLTVTGAPVKVGQVVKVSYIAPGSNPIRDSAGNAAATLTDWSVDVADTAGPALTDAVLVGATLTLTYDEEPFGTSAPAASAFTVKVDGNVVDLEAANPPNISGSTVVLTLASQVLSADREVTVSYVVPDANPLRDVLGNFSLALTDEPVSVTDTTPPVFQSASVARTALTLTWNERLDTASVPAASVFTVKVDDSVVGLETANPPSGLTLTLTLARRITADDSTVTVSYTAPAQSGANPIRDRSGNAAASFSDQTVTIILSNDATLSDLALEDSGGNVLNVSPAFSADVTSYVVTVGTEVTLARVTATVTDAGHATLAGSLTKAGGTAETVEMTSGEPTELSVLVLGQNVLEMMVTAEDGNTMQSYTLTVTMEQSEIATLGDLVVVDERDTELDLDPVFDSETLVYAVSVGGSVTQAKVTATLNDARASLTGSLTRADGSANDVEMDHGIAAELSDLTVGENILMITVTAEDETTTRTYELTVTREASTGPLKAWLARFGRTVAEHALDGVAGRIRASRAAGFRGDLGGLPATSVSSSGTGFDGHDQLGREAEEATIGEMLLGSSFSMTGEADGSGGSLAYWGRAAQSRFDGRDGDLSVDGEVTTGMVGVDYSRDRWTLGLSLTHSDGDGGYSGGESLEGGRIEATLTAVVPWSSWQATERLDFWGAVGKGSGKATLTPKGSEAVRTDIGWSMAALGMRNELMSPADAGYAAGTGPSLALNMDAMWVRTTSGAAASGELSATASEVSRLRVGVEGEWGIGLENGGRLVPHMELAVRRDGGDAEVGAGFELGGGLIWQDPELGLSMELAGRTLMAHDVEGRKESGYAVSMVYDPAPATARGASFSLRQDWGAQASGGVDTLFSSGPMPSVGGSGSSSGRWEAEAAYGIPAFGGDFTSSPHVGFGQSDGGQDYSLGWRVTPEGTGAPDLSVGLETTRQERAGAAAKHGIGIGVSANW